MIATIKNDTNRNEPISYLGRESLIAEYARPIHSGLINDYEYNYFSEQFLSEDWTTDTEGQEVIPIPPNIYKPNCFVSGSFFTESITNVHTLEICSCRSIYSGYITSSSDPAGYEDLPIWNIAFVDNGCVFLCAIANNQSVYIRLPNGQEYKEGSTIIGDSQDTYVGTTNITMDDMWYAENIAQSEWYTSSHDYTSIFSTITVVVSENLISFYCNGKRKKTYENTDTGQKFMVLPNSMSNDLSYGGYVDEPGGMVCAVRLYDRVLTDDEIANNALQDRLLYL